MFKLFRKATVISIALLGLSAQVNATLILDTFASGTATPETLGGYAMTDFDLVSTGIGTQISTVNSPLGGSVGIEDENGTVTLGLADANAWWVNGEAGDYNIFTTSTHTIEIILPENTFAFSFNVGVNTNAGAWFKAYDNTGSYADLGTVSFGLGTNNTPGFGIYADNSNGSCSSISRITVDPSFIWGVGNFSINQGTCASVPEPSSIALLAIGLLGLGFVRKTAR
jgi:PEP-CTERM motif